MWEAWMILNDNLASVEMARVPQGPGTNQTWRHRSGCAVSLPWGDLIKAPLGQQICADHTPAAGQEDGTFPHRPSEACQATQLALAHGCSLAPTTPRACVSSSVWSSLVEGMPWAWVDPWVHLGIGMYPYILCPYPILEVIFTVSTAPELTHTVRVIPPDRDDPRLAFEMPQL